MWPLIILVLFILSIPSLVYLLGLLMYCAIQVTTIIVYPFVMLGIKLYWMFKFTKAKRELKNNVR